MSEIVIERLARRLCKCPFDEELFDSGNSALSLRLHLSEMHSADICQPDVVARPATANAAERPRRLCCCHHCGFIAPDPGDENPITLIDNHIRTEHPNPVGPVQIRFRISEDETVIDKFMEQQGSVEVCVCKHASCNQIFAD